MCPRGQSGLVTSPQRGSPGSLQTSGLQVPVTGAIVDVSEGTRRRKPYVHGLNTAKVGERLYQDKRGNDTVGVTASGLLVGCTAQGAT